MNGTIFCRQCHQDLPADCFYATYIGPRTKRGKCKQCSIVGYREWKLANPEKAAAWRASEKHKAWRSAWGKKNRARLSVKLAEWRAENSDYFREYARAWRDQNREKVNATARASCARNKEKIAVRDRARRARMDSMIPPWADRKAIQAIYAEARRLRRETGLDYHVDHIIPLNGKNVSGLHIETNLQILPGIENMRKHNKVVEAAYQ